MKKSFLVLITTALSCLCFMACSEESRLGIKKPLITSYFNDDGELRYAIQSQDNNTIIEDIIVNRGNCGGGVLKYRINKKLDEVLPTKEAVENFCKQYKCYWNELAEVKDVYGKTYTVSGGYWGIYTTPNFVDSKPENIDWYNNLHDDFKQFYEKVEHKLAYGKTMSIPSYGCGGSDNILEIQLILNGGKKITYNCQHGCV